MMTIGRASAEQWRPPHGPRRSRPKRRSRSRLFSGGRVIDASPVMPTIWPRFCRISTCGTCAPGTPVRNRRPFDRLGHLCGLSFFESPRLAGIEDIRAHVQLLGGFLGDGERIARHHFDLHAHLRAVAMVVFASSRGGSNRGKTRGTAFAISPARQRPGNESRSANSLTALSTSGFTCAESAAMPESPAAHLCLL